ncbi:MAG: hypothetical protein Q9182_007610 [Xanthomendoza sp. 2 TL-2023]
MTLLPVRPGQGSTTPRRINSDEKKGLHSEPDLSKQRVGSDSILSDDQASLGNDTSERGSNHDLLQPSNSTLVAGLDSSITRLFRNDQSFPPDENSDSASDSSDRTLSSARGARKTLNSFNQIGALPGPSSSFPKNSHEGASRRMTEQDIAGKDSQITILLDSWVDEYGVPKDWRKWVNFDPDYHRTTKEYQQQLSQYEKIAYERKYMQQGSFQLYGTAQHYDFDLLKCWVQFQVFRSHFGTWPPGYTPKFQKEDDSKSVASNQTLWTLY